MSLAGQELRSRRSAAAATTVLLLLPPLPLPSPRFVFPLGIPEPLPVSSARAQQRTCMGKMFTLDDDNGLTPGPGAWNLVTLSDAVLVLFS